MLLRRHREKKKQETPLEASVSAEMVKPVNNTEKPKESAKKANKKKVTEE